MPVATNPYIAGNPVGKSPAFVGREDVLREVLRILRSTSQNAITLFGQRRIGKTSVLQWLDSRLPGEDSFRPVYLDLQDKAAWPLGRVLGDLARAIAERLDLPAPELGANPEDGFRLEWLPQALQSLPAECQAGLVVRRVRCAGRPQVAEGGQQLLPLFA